MNTDFEEFKECIKFERKKSSYSTEARLFSVLSLRLYGKSVFYREDRSIEIAPGEVLYIPQGISYRQEGGAEEVISVHFYDPLAGGEIKVIKPQNTELVRQLFLLLAKVCKNMEEGYELKARSVFYELLYNLKSSKKSRISPSVAYMRRSFLKPDISMGDIAEKSGVSEVYFRKMFREEYGTAPVKYLNRLRVDYACTLLDGNYFSVEETAEKSGFNSSKYFSKVFSEVMGISPGKYAKRRGK